VTAPAVGEEAGTFHHVPRPPVTFADVPDVRRYAADSNASFIGVHATAGGHAAVVVRYSASRKSAVVEVSGGFGCVTASMEPDALRELARCCIDAAADLEARS